MTDTVTVDFGAMNDRLCDLFARWAVPDSRLNSHNRWNIDIYVDDQRGVVQYRFFSRDNMCVEITVDVADFLRSPEDYIGLTVMRLVSTVGEARQARSGVVHTSSQTVN